MRRPYEVYKKRNELIKKALTASIQEKLRVCPKNCRYNQMVKLDDSGLRLSMCMYGQHDPDSGAPLDVSKLIVCNSVKQARECNARIPRYPNEEAASAAITEELKDPVARRVRYADIVALEWVMDNDLHELIGKDPSLRTRFLMYLVGVLERLVRQPMFVNKKPQKLK